MRCRPCCGRFANRLNGAATRLIMRILHRSFLDKAYLGRPAAWMLQGLSGNSAHEPERRQVCSPTSSFPSPRPQPSLGRATRSGSIRRWCAGDRWKHTEENARIARETYRPDIYRAALKPLGVALPVANAKVEARLAGAHTRGLSRRKFGPRPRRLLRRRLSSIPTSSTAISPARSCQREPASSPASLRLDGSNRC